MDAMVFCGMLEAHESTAAPSLMLDAKAVARMFGWSAQTVRRRAADGTFPAPRSLPGRAVRWLRSDIERWAEALPVAR
jgi:predicted DNA-binding transcriptional regulator AlpA